MVEGDKDMGKTQIVVESIWGREKENVRVAKKERKKVMVEGEGEGERERVGWRMGVERVRMRWGGAGVIPCPNQRLV